ncbi:hypothetical protein [Lysobacter sp. N42]|uniref:hypothetical protein n=1 Tax=Lysobacter sp. N42 TaxID=2545719 RepID=UPI00104ACC4C|nr:hypothetical protein [Lysobacter sp. N42]TCZ77610.1 hypothetical protein EYQ95_26015 [Lysobacter sp. N42]
MSDTRSTRPKRWYRLWSLPLLIGGLLYLTRALSMEHLPFGLLGTGMLLGSIFAFRHNLLDGSPSSVDPRHVGLGWVALLAMSVLLVLAAAVVSVAA